MTPVLEAHDLHKTYVGGDGGTINVLKGVDLTLGRREMVAVVGASGAGKSTLLHVLGALDKPTRGYVVVGGEPINGLDEEQLAALRNRSVGLSGGEQQRTAVARALAMDPKVILADEPSGNLDLANAEMLHELLVEVVNDLEIGMIVVTHNRGLAGLAARVMLLEGGKLSETVVGGVVV